MVETAIYVLLGALTTALLALLALPAVSRRASRLAQARARLTAPLSAAEAQADRDALRGRHAIEITLADRRAEKAEEQWAAAQIALGQRAVEIARRDAALAEKSEDIARRRVELAQLTQELGSRAVEIGAREVAMHDLTGQRDAAELRFAETTAAFNKLQSEAELAHAQAMSQIEGLTAELSAVQRRSNAALFAANAQIADLERRLEQSESEALRLRGQTAELSEQRASGAPSGEDAPHALAEAAARERDFTVRLQGLTSAQIETQAELRAARAERDEASREASRLHERWRVSEARAQALSEADERLRQAIARLGRELVAGYRPAVAPLVDDARETAS